MNELALFAGAGGGILGGHLLGWRTVCAVEWEAYPASVLCARQNDGLLESFPIWDDVQTFDGKPWRGIVDVISGGFPCQDISVAGKQLGFDGEKSSMFFEVVRLLQEIEKERVEIGAIALDAAFSPVVSANYDVEEMRVGDRTDFNRLVIL